jgi:hypothetical protein
MTKIIYDPEGNWIFHEQGVKLTVKLYGVSEPYADIIVKRYRESDEARYWRHGYGSFPRRLTDFPFSRTYFLDYLERNPPGKIATKKHRRYATDDILIAKACKGIAEGKWPNAHRAARDLGRTPTEIERLRKKISAAISKTGV